MRQQQSAFFSHEHRTLIRQFITVRKDQILMSRRSANSIIPYPLQGLCGVLGTRKFIGHYIIGRETKASWLTAFVDNSTRNIKLQRIVWRVEDVDTHISKRTTAVIHHFSPVARMI